MKRFATTRTQLSCHSNQYKPDATTLAPKSNPRSPAVRVGFESARDTPDRLFSSDRVFPACATVEMPRASWLTFRRTYSSWAHEKGVPGKVVAALMGHAKVDTTLNVYTQVLDGSTRAAAAQVGNGLFAIVRTPDGKPELTH